MSNERNDRMIWRANSSRHDWSGGGPLRAVVAAATRLGLIGHPQADLSAESGEISGDDPAPWWLFWSVRPFDASSGWVQGIHNLALTFERSRVDSEALAQAFRSAHTPADTEYAFIHPYTHWIEFSHAHYANPVTINISFRGVFWANFLGPGHLDEFDLQRLRNLDAHEVEWVDDKGLFVIATPELASADAPEAEPVLIRLTEQFREALRPDSRWR